MLREPRCRGEALAKANARTLHTMTLRASGSPRRMNVVAIVDQWWHVDSVGIDDERPWLWMVICRSAGREKRGCMDVPLLERVSRRKGVVAVETCLEAVDVDAAWHGEVGNVSLDQSLIKLYQLHVDLTKQGTAIRIEVRSTGVWFSVEREIMNALGGHCWDG